MFRVLKEILFDKETDTQEDKPIDRKIHYKGFLIKIKEKRHYLHNDMYSKHFEVIIYKNDRKLSYYMRDTMNRASDDAFKFVDKMEDVDPYLLNIHFNKDDQHDYIVDKEDIPGILKDNRSKEAKEIDFYEYETQSYVSVSKSDIKQLKIYDYKELK